MKRLLLLLFLIPVITKAQQKDSTTAAKDNLLIKSLNYSELNNRMVNASLELKQYSNQKGIGHLFEIVGGMVTVVGLTATDKKTFSANGPALCGALIGVLGLLMDITADIHVGRAGVILHGNGISIPLNK